MSKFMSLFWTALICIGVGFIAGRYTSEPSISSPQYAPPPARVPATESSQNMGRVFVKSIPPGATIEIDGKTVGITPSEQVLPMGKRVEITIRRDNYIPMTKAFILTKNVDELAVTLQKKP